MQTKYYVIFIICIIPLLFGTSFDQSYINKISVDLEVKKLSKGTLYIHNAEMAYKANGDMIVFYRDPLNYYLINDKKGNISLYSPKDHKVTMLQDPYMGSNVSYFYHFLNFRQSDIGLRDWGFLLQNSNFENGLQVSNWSPPDHLTTVIGKIKLVHKNGNIVYAGYYAPSGFQFKKSYYGKGIVKRGVYLPETITEITYTNESKTDSIVEKSYYKNFKIDSEVNTSLFDFKVPKDAKITRIPNK